MPTVVKWAADAIIAGTALPAALGGFATAHWGHHSRDIGSGVPGLILGIFLTAAGCAPWLATASMVLAGRAWSRVLSAVFFVGYVAWFVPSLVLSLADPPGGQPSAALVAALGLELLVGLAANVLLWQHASGQYFSACKQARSGSAEAARDARRQPN